MGASVMLIFLAPLAILVLPFLFVINLLGIDVNWFDTLFEFIEPILYPFGESGVLTGLMPWFSEIQQWLYSAVTEGRAPLLAQLIDWILQTFY